MLWAVTRKKKMRFAYLKNPKKTFCNKYPKGSVRVNHVEVKRGSEGHSRLREPVRAKVWRLKDGSMPTLKRGSEIELRAPKTEPGLSPGPPPQAVLIVK